jgi:hypothetical protein
MLRFILHDLTLFGDGDDVERARKALCWFMEGLVQRNIDYLKSNPSTPRLYKSGVRYQVPMQFDGDCEEVKVLREALGSKARSEANVAHVLDLVQAVLGGERFRDIGRIIENGGGDCDNLACWRVAELRQCGIEARPFMTHRTRFDGGTTYHALVLWPPVNELGRIGNKAPDHLWTTEDPSLLLGMGGAERADDRAEEIRKNNERCDLLSRRSGRVRDAADILGQFERELCERVRGR